MKSLIDIQRNYTLYGVKGEGEERFYSGSVVTSSKDNKGGRRLSLGSKVNHLQGERVKSLKNPFL